jgi:hypothetical protein
MNRSVHYLTFLMILMGAVKPDGRNSACVGQESCETWDQQLSKQYFYKHLISNSGETSRNLCYERGCYGLVLAVAIYHGPHE